MVSAVFHGNLVDVLVHARCVAALAGEWQQLTLSVDIAIELCLVKSAVKGPAKTTDVIPVRVGTTDREQN